jgi:hypothetical protein
MAVEQARAESRIENGWVAVARKLVHQATGNASLSFEISEDLVHGVSASLRSKYPTLEEARSKADTTLVEQAQTELAATKKEQRAAARSRMFRD